MINLQYSTIVKNLILHYKNIYLSGRTLIEFIMENKKEYKIDLLIHL